MKKMKIVLTIIAVGIIFFVISSYFITTPDNQRLTLEQAVTEAEGYLNTPLCVVDQGCHKNGNSINVDKFFSVYETRDDIPDYIFFPINFHEQKSWPDTIGVHLFPDEIYTTGNYWDTIDELKGVDGTNKLYRLSDMEWYGVPQNISDQTQVEAFCHEFSKPSGCMRSTINFDEFQSILKKQREVLESQKDSPFYRMKILVNKIL